MSRRIANRAAEKGPSATQMYVHVGAPSAARSWLFELRGEATRRGLRQRIYSALVSRPTAAAQLELRGAASHLDLFEQPAAVGYFLAASPRRVSSTLRTSFTVSRQR